MTSSTKDEYLGRWVNPFFSPFLLLFTVGVCDFGKEREREKERQR